MGNDGESSPETRFSSIHKGKSDAEAGAPMALCQLPLLPGFSPKNFLETKLDLVTQNELNHPLRQKHQLAQLYQYLTVTTRNEVESGETFNIYLCN